MGYLDSSGLAHFWEKVKGYVDERTEGGEASPSDLVNAPIGAIIAWSRSVEEIPSGWHICDGTEGTVDLRDKFVLGAGGKYNLNATGGAETVTLTVEQMPEHKHTISMQMGNNKVGGNISIGDYPAIKFENRVYTSTSTTGSSQPHPNMPPYLALIYIQKIGVTPTDYVTEERVDEKISEAFGEVYSTEETRIGTWIDGKPLYQMVFEFTLPPNVNVDTVVATTADNKLVQLLDGMILFNNRQSQPLNASSGSLSTYVFYKRGELRVIAGGEAVNRPAWCVIKYTKTTD